MELGVLPVAAEQRERETREREKRKRGTGVAVLIFGGELLRAPAAAVGDGFQGAMRGWSDGRRQGLPGWSPIEAGARSSSGTSCSGDEVGQQEEAGALGSSRSSSSIGRRR